MGRPLARQSGSLAMLVYCPTILGTEIRGSRSVMRPANRLRCLALASEARGIERLFLQNLAAGPLRSVVILGG